MFCLFVLFSYNSFNSSGKVLKCVYGDWPFFPEIYLVTQILEKEAWVSVCALNRPSVLFCFFLWGWGYDSVQPNQVSPHQTLSKDLVLFTDHSHVGTGGHPWTVLKKLRGIQNLFHKNMPGHWKTTPHQSPPQLTFTCTIESNQYRFLGIKQTQTFPSQPDGQARFITPENLCFSRLQLYCALHIWIWIQHFALHSVMYGLELAAQP